MRWLLLVMGLMACGPRVESPDDGEASTSSDGTTSAGTSTTSTAGTSTTTASTLTTSADVTTVPPTSGTDESGSSTTGPVPECTEAGFEYAYFTLDENGAFELDAECDIVEFGNGLDSTYMALDCGADGMHTVLGTGLDLEELLAEHPRVYVRAAGVSPGWSHLAVYDLSGSLLFGTYDLSPAALDAHEWFLPLEWEIVVDQCQLERGEDCPEERVAIDFTHQAESTRIFDRNADVLAGYELVAVAVRDHPGAAMGCPDEPTMRGWFFTHRL
jgi:hypothetical protein